jgi:hypothetical protein
MGHHQAPALVPTFHALYQLAILVSHVIEINDLFSTSPSIKESVVDLYCDVVELIGNVAVVYRQKINTMGSNQAGSLDFQATFGARLTSIWKRRDLLITKMWNSRLGHRASGPSLDSLHHFLKRDHCVRDTFYEDVAESLSRAEDSCDWLKTHLIEFLRSGEKAFTITGAGGSGKTVLAGWIRDRLQRPLDHSQYCTISYSFREFSSR